MEQLDVTSLKRYSQDTLDYPRRRATIACEICRSRKSRCDGARPKCRLCSELGADCNYREPGIKLDAGDKLILAQLERIEGLLHSNLTSPISAVGGPISPATSNTASDDLQARRVNSNNTNGPSVGALPLNGLGTWSANISTIPPHHTTPALHLLQWPVIRDLISRQCDPGVLVQLEMSREPLNLTRHYSLDFTNMTTYTQAYFDRVNVWYAIVNPYAWTQYYQNAASMSFRSGAESCVVLLVLALGEAAHSGISISRLPHDVTPPGMSFFAAAWKILPSLMIKNDVLSAQCHIMAAAYLMYLVRPLEAWNLLCNASMKQQLLLSSPHAIPPHQRELNERVYWNTLMIESDLLAELDLPQSGIVQFEENMRLPRSFPYDAPSPGAELPGSDDLWYFLAEIALRRLLNRVSHLMYTHKRNAPFSVNALDPVVAELDFQLDQWYESLPSPVKFPKDRLPVRNQVQTVLRLRYYACRTIIYRPYIQAVLTDESLAAEMSVQDACRKCLEACVRQLEYVTAHHEGHLPYLWQGALSLMSQTLIIMAATLSPALNVLLPPANQMDVIIGEVVTEVERVAHLAPSLGVCAEIVREAEERRLVMTRRPNR
ncbi:hypothetical protein BAUCODRAFT_123202 [Baudoinia panamericana UAMH 10762]|uniref:Zn(2)-C6 fungal-type domain-containing protein n=1 Tax=Baudoinia panamericana (strain UAMH 10762) TaxID=717646 RepID=M2MWJ4_BAUPA|nr:uncharacterized protein BAUCODRAFT_123202 [Baudoinia panamericana UAMH 10762]EMC95918.1 hypothetical protein BAUCODRAFT_123202 [Baudoinia panamericana UAMH 10762]